MSNNILSAEIEVPVRFSEVDSLRIVWHGHYVKYFEEAREAFGRKYNISYLQVYGNGFVTPIVKLTCDYKSPLEYGDIAVVKATYIPTEAAKIVFQFEIRNKKNNLLVATGESIQVLLNKDNELQLTVPDFLAEWKSKNIK